MPIYRYKAFIKESDGKIRSFHRTGWKGDKATYWEKGVWKHKWMGYILSVHQTIFSGRKSLMRPCSGHGFHSSERYEDAVSWTLHLGDPSSNEEIVIGLVEVKGPSAEDDNLYGWYPEKMSHASMRLIGVSPLMLDEALKLVKGGKRPARSEFV